MFLFHQDCKGFDTMDDRPHKDIAVAISVKSQLTVGFGGFGGRGGRSPDKGRFFTKVWI